MDPEIIGMIGPKADEGASKGREVHVIGGGIDPEYISAFSKVHEESGFDKVLVGYSSSSADGFLVALHAAANTKKLGYLIAHRPGFVSPTVLARKVATLDHLTGGRIALHIISGGGDSEHQRDGDFLDHADRYKRSEEFMSILKKLWLSNSEVDHAGQYYRFVQAKSDIDCYQSPHVPLYFGGASEIAIDVAARQSDVYAMWGEPLDAIGKKIQDVKLRMKSNGRNLNNIKFSVSTRPIVAETEKEAWDIAHEILDGVLNTKQRSMHGSGKERLQSVGAKNLVDFAKQGDVLDDRLYMPIAAATGGSGNTTALVGTADQVSDSLLNYYKIGCSTLLIRGFDPFNDAVYWGKELIPLLREKIKKYSSQSKGQVNVNK